MPLTCWGTTVVVIGFMFPFVSECVRFSRSQQTISGIQTAHVHLPRAAHPVVVTARGSSGNLLSSVSTRAEHVGKLLGNFNCDQVAFYKTHKTGSTTLGSVLYRVGVLRRKM
jgi:hypothetical protein